MPRLILSALPVPHDCKERLKPEILQLRVMHLTPPLEHLHEKGGIVVKKDKEPRVLDIRFKEGVLDIPLLVLDDDTVAMLFNFVALEECMGGESPFKSYFLLLNSLICSESDVEILVNERVMEHSLESNKHVVSLIKELAKNMVYEESNTNYFHVEVAQMNQHHNEALSSKRAQRKLKWHRWFKDLKNRYFSNPWAVLSLVAAILLLILTFVQTFFTMFAYYKPPN